jgi:hypothetical protein
MNRIERLIWEERQLATIQRLQRESHGRRSAKVAGVIALVAAIALLANRVPLPHLDDVVVQALTPASIFYTPAAAPNPRSDVRRATETGARDPADEDGP